MKQRQIKENIIKATAIALLFSIIIATITIVIYSERMKYIKSSYEILAMNKLVNAKDKIQNSLNSELNYAEFFQVLITNNKTINLKEFNRFSNLVISQSKCIKSITIAPKGIVKYVYPLEENKKDLNLNLLEDKVKGPFVAEAIRKHKAVSQGPIKTAEGENLLVNRQPIYIMEKEKEIFWGLAIVTIDFNKLMAETGLKAENGEFYFSLRTVNTTDKSMEFYWGKEEIFKQESITHYIELADGRWELAIYPKGGWTRLDSSLNMIVILGIIAVFLTFIITYRYILLNLVRKMQATTDSLTGAMNKGEFYRYFDKQISSRIRSDFKGGLLIIDVDDFKKINDQFGHQAGDIALTQISSKVRKVLRKQDKIARIGGDEFVVLIQSLSHKEELNIIAKRILEEVTEPINFGDVNIKVTVSIGGVIFPDEGISLEQLFTIADSNMYHSKRNGKNKFIANV